MARADVMEVVGEGVAGTNGPFHHRFRNHRLRSPRSTGVWLGPLDPHSLDCLQNVYLLHQLPRTPYRRSDTPPSQPQPPSPRPEEERSGGEPALSGEEADSNRHSGHRTDASTRRAPLPDLLPRSERPPRLSAGQHVLEMDVQRVARQLKQIGDEFNATALHRVNNAPQWRDWQDLCRGVLNLISHAISAIYRLT